MQFTINQKRFLKGLALAQNIAERRGTMPMMSNALITTDGESALLIRATDLQITMRCRIESSNAEPGSIAVGAKSLYEIVKNLPQEELHVQKTGSNHVELRSGPARFRMVGLLSDDYPEVPVAPDEGFDKVPIPTPSHRGPPHGDTGGSGDCPLLDYQTAPWQYGGSTLPHHCKPPLDHHGKKKDKSRTLRYGMGVLSAG